MARHFVAVCVVCLLCADRLPCEQHVDSLLAWDAINSRAQDVVELPELNARVYPAINNLPTMQQHANLLPATHAHASAKSRRKRHVGGHDHEQQQHLNPEITEHFIQKILQEYGNIEHQQQDQHHSNKTSMSINAKNFRRLLKRLQLHHLITNTDEEDTAKTNKSCIADVDLVEYVQLPHNCKNDLNSTAPCSTTKEKAPSLGHLQHSSHDLRQSTDTLNNAYTLNAQDILNLCPVLLYHLDSPTDKKRAAGCINEASLVDITKYADVLGRGSGEQKEDIFFVWIYAFISVFACSLLGLVGVAIIPFMDSHYYKDIIQFLVSLAVGTMTGDALLHLLPHSLAGQTEENMIFKGFVCMGGIIFFYITEHGLTMISEWRKEKAKKETKAPKARAKVMRDPDSSHNNSIAGDKLCKSKYSSYPYCYDDIAMDTKNDVWLHLPSNTAITSSEFCDNVNLDKLLSGGERKRNGKAEADANCAATQQSLLSTSHNNYAPIAEMNHHNHHHHHHGSQQNNHCHQHQHNQEHQQRSLPDNSVLCTDLDAHSLNGNNALTDGVGAVGVAGTEKIANNETVTVILREHESSHHGHSHKHGHVHSPPESLSAVAWMIIMGDGLHNFTDGMAIGAAFAENIAGGFSTSLAVFCHELPHELGDFAILLKAGMSVKTAVYYNLLTGVLSFIGMIFGIAFGQSHDTAQWMFAAAAGLFIYIALVDMIPELSSSHKSIQQFALQILGMCSGVLIMLLIAIFEGDLMNVFGKSTSTGSTAHVH